MSSPGARGLTEEWVGEHGDPMDWEFEPEPEHWKAQEEALDRWLAVHPYDASDRARFDESLELARDQLAFPVPERDDDERERG